MSVASTPSSLGGSRAGTPTPFAARGRPDERAPLTAHIAYKASEAVARALLELELPGSLARATALLRSVAEEQEQRSASVVAHDDEDGAYVRYWLPELSGYKAGDPRVHGEYTPSESLGDYSPKDATADSPTEKEQVEEDEKLQPAGR